VRNGVRYVRASSSKAGDGCNMGSCKMAIADNGQNLASQFPHTDCASFALVTNVRPWNVIAGFSPCSLAPK